MKIGHTLLATALLSSMPLLSASADETPPCIWIESETAEWAVPFGAFDKKPGDPGFARGDLGAAHLLSGGQALDVFMDGAEALARVPESGVVVRHVFDADEAGRHALWNRIGLEWVRSDFDWRVNGGDWRTLSSQEPTTDLVPLGFWSEIAWIQLGEVDLRKGSNTLEIRLSVAKDGKGRPRKLVYRSDALCLSQGPFRPNFKWRPDDAGWRDARAEQAAAQVFPAKLPAAPGERAETSLAGLWRIARWDEQGAVSEETRETIPDALPGDLDARPWYAYAVPGSRNGQLPEWAFAHRYLVRTTLDVPAAGKDHGYFLDIQSFNFIAGVFVNGVKCGWSKAFDAAWRCDITAGVRPGQPNDLVVVFKDAYYALPGYALSGYTLETAPLGARSQFNLPVSWLGQSDLGRGVGHVSRGLVAPLARNTRTGFWEPVSLVVTGPAYAADVFCQPSVTERKLDLEVTLANPSDRARTVTLETEIVPWNRGRGGEAEKTFRPVGVTVQAGSERTLVLSEPWAEPRLWWPDDPHLYWAVTTVRDADGRALDVRRTRFGFRQIEWKGSTDFRLNGVRWQFWAGLGGHGGDLQASVDLWRRTGQNMYRYWGWGGIGGRTKRETLDFFDEQGVMVRRSGVFDGSHVNYTLVRDGKPVEPLVRNWIEQMRGWLKAERNHPSVFIWSMENEIVFINSANRGWVKSFEPAVTRAWESVRDLDPTRPFMVDGGRALFDESLEINGCHYEESASGIRLPGDYPDAAYDTRCWYAEKQRGNWPMKTNAPIFLGENFYAKGFSPGELAPFCGDQAFMGRAAAEPGVEIFGRMLFEGNRWAGVAANHCWFTLPREEARAYIPAWSPVAVLCRQWNWTFEGGARVPRTLRLFNNSRFDGPVEVSWQLTLGDRALPAERRVFDLAPGRAETFEVALALPEVDGRQEGVWTVVARRGGQEVFRQTHAVSVLRPDAAPKPALADAALGVFDPDGGAKAHLARRGVPFTDVADPARLPPSVQVLVVGRDAVSEAMRGDPLWLRLAAEGRRLLVLEQTFPLRHQAIPADLDAVAAETGRIGFAEDLTHPVMAGLAQKDFFTWSGDHVLYRQAFRKATRGARSLIQCGRELGFSALAECRVNDGLMVLGQLAVGEKLASDPVARRLFDNALNYLADYRSVRREVVAALPADDPRTALLRNIDLAFRRVDDPAEALAVQGGVAIVDASPANLSRLARASGTVKAFTEKGGILLFWGLTPEGLADYNRIVGYDHLVRPFAEERVVLARPPDPLTSGLTLRDVVMEDTDSMFSFMASKWKVDDAFSYIVDYTDIGPFCALPAPEVLGRSAGPPYTTRARMDQNPANLFNGFTGRDAWPYAYMVDRSQGAKDDFTLTLPREEAVESFSIIMNTFYNFIASIDLFFDDDPVPETIALQPHGERQDFSFPPRRATRLRLAVKETVNNNPKDLRDVIGIDNLWIGVRRPEAFLANVKPLLNIGGLVRYTAGEGMIVLNQLRIGETERNPVNVQKKATIVKTLLANLGADFAGGATLVVGMDIDYAPVVWQDGLANAFLARQESGGWFDRADFSQFPVGEQTLGQVPYSIPDFRTSPVPSAILLKGEGSSATVSEVKGIQVGRQADALFFLHTARLGAACRKQIAPGRKGPLPEDRHPTVFVYRVHYADGRQVEVPVRAGIEIGDWRRGRVETLPRASVAWRAPLEQGDEAGVYAFQWANPRPGTPIASIDLVTSDDGKWGAPALLAITVATRTSTAPDASATR